MRTPDGPWAVFWRTPLRLRLYLLLIAVAAVALSLLLNRPVGSPNTTEWVTVAALLAVSVLNVEVSRGLSGGLAHTQQPHKALSAWAFATALLLPTAWLLVVVPVTYAHARWRGIRVPLWKWIGSGLYLVLCGVAAASIRHELLGDQVNWMAGDGHRGFLTMLVAGTAFLALQTLLFTGSAFLNDADDERWLRGMLSSPGFYLTESGVLLLGGLFSAVWTAGFWFCLLFVPLYILLQHAVLVGPLRERAAAAVELEARNRELKRLNRFQTDLMSMLGHEIGNPLTSVIGYTETGIEAVAAHDLDAAAAALAVVDRNAGRVAAVLTDIAQLVAADTGTLTAAPEDCVLGPRLLSALEQLPADRRPEVGCPDGLAVRVQPGHLDQILANLFSNAEKYGGGATGVHAHLDPTGHVELAVVDQGPGIPEHFRVRLFERYQRDATTARVIDGTGVGLFISRELARVNGGDLHHQPGPGAGAQFVLRLPVAG